MLTGRSRAHIVDLDEPRCSLHGEVVRPFLALRAAARTDGIDLTPSSSYRDFGRQLAIWNGKYRGERELLDPEGRRLDPSLLGEEERVDSILVWSALPGASRHHWGTDLDVFDAAAVPPGYQVKLTVEEYAPGGVFARLDQWLERHAERHGFFRPYTVFRGGVRPEPWHLSYAPVAAAALEQFSPAMLQQALEEADLDAKEVVRRRLPEIFARYVRNVDAPPGVGLTPGTRLA